MTRHAFDRTSLSARLPATPDAPAIARRHLDVWLPGSITDGDRGALRLLVTELVTNSVRHSDVDQDAVALDVDVDGDLIRVRVSDGGTGFEPHTPKPRGASGGYGLFLVERMAERWGVERKAGTQVWFELALTPPARA
jgi:anti-sigma regulatory factor (Ser/Thr protein kinase)